MRNERRMSGSARGDEKPTAAKRYGAHRLLNPKNRMRNLDRFSSWLSLADLRLAQPSQLRTIFGVFAISFAVKLRVSIAQL